jgi:hypothetical protein
MARTLEVEGGAASAAPIPRPNAQPNDEMASVISMLDVIRVFMCDQSGRGLDSKTTHNLNVLLEEAMDRLEPIMGLLDSPRCPDLLELYRECRREHIERQEGLA